MLEIGADADGVGGIVPEAKGIWASVPSAAVAIRVEVEEAEEEAATEVSLSSPKNVMPDSTLALLSSVPPRDFS